jgi:hypothetical protein
MRKIVDTNFFQCEGLRAYLAKSPQHYAVLTDYAAMEAYKGDTLASIYRSMEIFSQYPKQVIVLKPTGIVCGLSGRRAGLPRRLIDERQTREFATYCRALLAAKRGDASVQAQVLKHGQVATASIDAMLADAANIPSIIDELASETYTNEELQIVRKRSTYTEQMISKMFKNITLLSMALFRDHPRVTQKPPLAELINTFIFRIALCGNLLAQEWISVGGARGVKPERIRNDIVDISFAAYATYFHGLLTSDKKLQKIFGDAVFWIEALSRRSITRPHSAEVPGEAASTG